MKMLLLSLVFFSIMGCSKRVEKSMPVKFVVTNASSHPLTWVKFIIEERELSPGVLPSGISSTIYDVPWSKVPDQAKVTFIDEQTRQSYEIVVSLVEVNKQVQAETCHTVTLRISDYDKAEIVCQ